MTATTKRSPAQSPAKTRSTQAKKKPALAAVPASTVPAVMPSPAEWPSYFEHDGFTRTHEMIVDAVTEMLSTGGHHDDVDTLLHATMSHHRRRFFGPTLKSSSMLAENLQSFIRDDFNRWKTDLMIAWRKNEWPERPAPVEPKSVTDRIRANFRETLKGQFENFMSAASPEEIRLLSGVFLNWESRHSLPEFRDDEISLGHAFELELNSRGLPYLRVPEHMLAQVQNYVDALRAVEDAEDQVVA